jgi:PilZ domain
MGAQLSSEVFREIVRQLKGTPVNDDKRRSPRVGLRGQVPLTLLAKDDGNAPQTYMVSVRDLSPDGIGIMHHLPLASGTHFAIRLPSRDHRDLSAVYIVKHCKPLEKDLFGIGAHLLKLHDPGAAYTSAKKKAEAAAKKSEASPAAEKATAAAKAPDPPTAAAA